MAKQEDKSNPIPASISAVLNAHPSGRWKVFVLVLACVVVLVIAGIYVSKQGGESKPVSLVNSPQMSGSDNTASNSGNQAGGNITVTNNYAGPSELDAIIQDAQGGGASAYDKLCEKLKNPNFIDRDEKVARAVQDIASKYKEWMFPSDPPVPQKMIDEMDKLKFDAVQTILLGIGQTPDEKDHLIKYVKFRSDTSKHDRIQCLVTLIGQEQSLRHRRQAIRYIDILSGQQFMMIDREAVADWWKKSGDKVKD